MLSRRRRRSSVPGAKIGQFFKLNLTKPYILQRLTARTYFFAGGFYTATFYVGDEGVLVFDPPERQGDNLVQAIAEVTELPLKAIAYSHYHADHMIGAVELLEAAGATAARRACGSSPPRSRRRRWSLMKSGMPAPTETVAWPAGDVRVRRPHGPARRFRPRVTQRRCGGFLLVQEQVAHLPDLVNGDQPPFRRFAISENHAYYRSNVNQLGALDWTHLVGGHGNVGSKDDIRFYNTFLDDLEEAVAKGDGPGEVRRGRRPRATTTTTPC